MRSIALLIINLITIALCFSQSLDDLSQLKSDLKNASHDTTRVRILLEISQHITNGDEKLYYASRAKKISENNQYQEGVASSLVQEGIAHLINNKENDALKVFQEASKKFSSLNNTRMHCKALIKIGECYDILYETDSALYYFEHAEKLASENNFSELEARGIYFQGNIYNDIGENVKAANRLTRAMAYYDSVNNKEYLWMALNSLGIVYDDIGNYPEAIKSYMAALEIANEIKDIEGQVMLYNNMASFYYQVGKLKEALTYYDFALNLYVRGKNGSDEWYLLNNKAQIFMELGDTVSSLIHLQKAYDIVKNDSGDCELVYILDGIGSIMLGKANLDSARSCFNTALELADRCDNHLIKAILLRGLGEVSIRQHKYSEGVKLFDRSIRISDDAGYYREKEKTCYQLYLMYKKLGNHAKALEFYEIHAVLKDSLFNNSTNMEVARISSEYEFKKELHKMEYLKHAEELKLMSKLDKESSNKNVLLLVLILTVLLAATLVRSYFLLQNHNKRLEKLNEEKNTLMGVVAHDLRSPLNNIKGLIGLITNDPRYEKSAPDNKKYISLLSDSANHMREMIDKALDINAIEEMRLNLNIDKYDLGKILQEIGENFKFLALKKNITIHFDFDLQKYFAHIDKNYTIQIFDNLLSNAIKFSPNDKNIYLKMEKEEGVVNIIFQDEGPGLSERDRSKLFTKYQKLAAKPTGDEESIGLGLSIVKKFVDAMNGEIFCESQLGHGCTFIVRFKAA